MNKPSFLTESFGRRSLSIVTVSILLLLLIRLPGPVLSAENGSPDRQEVFRKIVQNYIQTGQEEYDKGYFEQAEKTFLMAQGYQEYLTATGREDLKSRLDKARLGVANRKLALETFVTVNQLIKQDRIIEAKTQLEQLRNNQFLSKDQQAQIAEVLRQINVQIIEDKVYAEKVRDRKLLTEETLDKITEDVKKPSEQANRQEEIVTLFHRSVVLYRTGQYEKAREGFVEVATSGLVPPLMKETIQSYIANIDKILPARTVQAPVPEPQTPRPVIVPEPNLVQPPIVEPRFIEPRLVGPETSELRLPKPQLVEPGLVMPGSVAPGLVAPRVTSSATAEGSYIEKINTKRNILRSYTATVVNDAIVKAHTYMYEGNFDEAKKALETAEFTVNENQMHLGDQLFREYSGKLKTLKEEIAKSESEKARQLEEQKRQAAVAAQRQFREQMEVDRQTRITELMKNALAYQKQQLYEDALGQLESLLALDPQHDEALILKDTLEDMIYFRKQLEVQKEADKQRAEILLETDKAGIPFAADLTYSKDWLEIMKREPDEPIGLDPVDANVYERLEHEVDLSTLTPGMPFSDVINQLKISVEPPLQIQPNWKDLLENADLPPTTPAGMDPLTGVKLRKVLEVLLDGVSSEFAQISYVVDEGVIQIATLDTLPPKMVPRVYNIADLVGEPANYRQMGGMMGGMGGMMGGMGGMMGGMGGYGGGMGGMGGMMGGMGGYGGGMGG